MLASAMWQSIAVSVRQSPALVLARVTRAACARPGTTDSSAGHMPPLPSMAAATVDGMPLRSNRRASRRGRLIVDVGMRYGR